MGHQGNIYQHWFYRAKCRNNGINTVGSETDNCVNNHLYFKHVALCLLYYVVNLSGS